MVVKIERPVRIPPHVSCIDLVGLVISSKSSNGRAKHGINVGSSGCIRRNERVEGIGACGWWRVREGVAHIGAQHETTRKQEAQHEDNHAETESSPTNHN